MQHNFLTTMRSLKLIDSCKGSQVYALNHTHSSSSEFPSNKSLRSSKSIAATSSSASAAALSAALLPYGLPVPDLIEPPIDPFLRPLDVVSSLSSSYRAFLSSDDDHLPFLHLRQFSLLRPLNDPKLLRRSLRSARIRASSVHDKLVLSAWLRLERRDESSSPSDCPGLPLECPRSSLRPGPDALGPCPCRRDDDPIVVAFDGDPEPVLGDVVFIVGSGEVNCVRANIASLSKPLKTMLFGGFSESWRETIDFTQIGISIDTMRAIESFSRTGSVDSFSIDTLLELLPFANRFCCEGLKCACDERLASMIATIDDAIAFVEYGLDETAHLLVAACLQLFLRELPWSLHNPDVTRLLCSPEGKARLDLVEHASFMLYYLLSQVSMEEDMRSNTTVMLLERLSECALSGWQRQLAMHQLGCVMLERGEFKDAQNWFEEAARDGHAYSLAGVARAKFKRGHKYSAYKQMNGLLSEHEPIGWMYQERSLYCIGKEKMLDLDATTELDPTLTYPYKYRAVMLAEEGMVGAAIAEINKILRFRVSPDCLELRAWFALVVEDYEGALRDVRALMTLDPDYMMFHGRVHGEQMIEVLRQHVQQLKMVDCWMQLYDRWSSVDDIGSLAVVHQMLAEEPGQSLLRFRQSLLLLRLNCQKAAMRSLRLARNHSKYDHERLVYEGWILYDTGNREEALAKAEESISIQRSFEAFFLKAYALADTCLDQAASLHVIEVLREALTCPSDGLRKGQALNNLGSVYVDMDELNKAEECYVNALDIRHTRAHQGLARVYHLRHQRKAAYGEMTKLIEKARNNASAYEKRSEYCDRDMARCDLSMATQLDPLRTYPYRYRAAVLMDDHKEAEAIAELSKAISFKPDLQLLHLRAAFHDSMGDTTSTLRDCEAALCLDPNHTDTLDLYSKACEKCNQQKKIS
ncbi:Ethylene-overproduction protein 1 [Acorus gramineus]|uniref:Ethylene-overproduction protein 1 n=1 Tax=Acorus gramineus TaxID=55184 RepID=A0AAV9B620_ACOGR|nr:Ethylene-overproduction protein 1 [Acorus gramineus]